MRKFRHRPIRVGALAGVCAVFANAMSARADAIDGDWCFAALTMNIQGPRIKIPGGAEITGDYTRHSFRYVTPAAEPGAGSPVAMQLLNEENMSLTRGNPPGDPEAWKRCKPIS